MNLPPSRFVPESGLMLVENPIQIVCMARPVRMLFGLAACVMATWCLPARAETLQTDLLIVGGTESGWAAAIQAACLGVKSITVVHDGSWPGGQCLEQGLVCVDESKGVGEVGWGPDWHPMK